MAENFWIDKIGVRVKDMPMPKLYGAYIHERGLILLNDRLAPIQRRSTLMHELGHAFYGHTESTARTEREASEWAARQMIPGCEFYWLTKIYESPVSIASELGVLPRDVVNYAKWVESFELMKMA